jgi:hypothetical protein
MDAYDCYRMFHGGGAEYLGQVFAESMDSAWDVARLRYGFTSAGDLYIEKSSGMFKWPIRSNK